jgi:hypothetical protein
VAVEHVEQAATAGPVAPRGAVPPGVALRAGPAQVRRLQAAKVPALRVRAPPLLERLPVLVILQVSALLRGDVPAAPVQRR